MNDLANAEETCTACEDDCQKKADDDHTDKFGELVQRLHAFLACVGDIVDNACKFDFD
jgi:hypothetical protein